MLSVFMLSVYDIMLTSTWGYDYFRYLPVHSFSQIYEQKKYIYANRKFQKLKKNLFYPRKLYLKVPKPVCYYILLKVPTLSSVVNDYGLTFD